jgi:hypothetical protein
VRNQVTFKNYLSGFKIGKKLFPNGTQYEGEFKDDLFCGQGKIEVQQSSSLSKRCLLDTYFSPNRKNLLQ